MNKTTFTNIDIATPPAEQTVTAEWLKQLRSVVRWSDKALDSAGIVVDARSTSVGPVGTVTLFVERREPAAEFGRVSLRYEQPTFGAAVESYGVTVGRAPGQRYVASQRHYRGDPLSPLLTLANLVRVGDSLRPYFRIANDNQQMIAKGVTRDECYLLVYRGNTLVGSVHIETIIVPVDNLYSMIDNSGLTEVTK